jgi:BMFP domain-containing protein YqiC
MVAPKRGEAEMADEEKAKGGTPAVSDAGDAGSHADDEFASEGSKQRVLADLRKAREAKAALETRVKEMEAQLAEADKSKPEMDKLREKLTALEERTAKAEYAQLRAEVAASKHLTPAQAKRLVGNTREELESDADELITEFGGTSNEGGKADAGAPDKAKTTGAGDLRTRPKENLRPGAVAGAEAMEMDPAKLAAKIPRDY